MGVKQIAKKVLTLIGVKQEQQTRLKVAVDKVLIKLGLVKNPLVLNSHRYHLARRYIRGSGLEIGAMHAPLKVRRGVEVKYVDRLSREEARARYPELDSYKMVEPTYVDDGFVLGSISDGSQDFLIANHVLEHSDDPIQALRIWCRVLKPKGILFCSVPVAERCFDKGREITGLNHMVEDHGFGEEGKRDELHRRNRSHYVEWVTISRPGHILAGKEAVKRDEKEIEAEIRDLHGKKDEIHFHTFTRDSFKELLAYFVAQVDRDMRLLTSVEEGIELVAVMQKK